MMTNDPIADMLTRIRNAGRAGRPETRMAHSRMKHEIARVMNREGYLGEIETVTEDGKKTLKIGLRYDAENHPVIRGLRRASRSGLRKYASADKLPRVLGGLGVAVISTSRGIMTDREARRARIGGEVLCHIW